MLADILLVGCALLMPIVIALAVVAAIAKALDFVLDLFN